MPPTPTTTEPEVLGPDSVQAAPKKRGQRERKPDSTLDPLRNHLASSGADSVALGESLEIVYGGAVDCVRIKAALQTIRRDPRFTVTGDGERARVALTEAAAADAQLDAEDAAEDAADVAASEAAEASLEPRVSLDEVAARVEALAEEPAAEPAAPIPGPGSQPAAEAPAPTIGERVEQVSREGGGLPRLPFAVEPGHRVLFKGPASPPEGTPARIVNIKDDGTSARYDLATASGRIDDVPAAWIEDDIAARDEVTQLREQLAAERRHRELLDGMEGERLELQGRLNDLGERKRKLRKALVQLEQKIADHIRANPYEDVGGAGQTSVFREGGVPRPQEPKEEQPAAALDELSSRIAAGDVIAWEGFTVPALLAAALSGTASTGKPQKVEPIERDGWRWIVADVQRASPGARAVAVLLPIYQKGEWPHADAPGVEVPNADRCEALAKRGKWCGLPVKVGRAVHWIGADADALLVALPDDAAEAVGREITPPPADDAHDGKAAAAGKD